MAYDYYANVKDDVLSCINDALDEIDRKYNDFYGVDREDDEE